MSSDLKTITIKATEFLDYDEDMDMHHLFDKRSGDYKGSFDMSDEPTSTPDLYHVVFRFHGHYRVASSDAPDLHVPFFNKRDALLEARNAQIVMGGDPNFVMDLTNAPEAELAEFLR
jgi:hypothetical protein